MSQVFSLCLSPPSLHRTTKASASGLKTFARSICSPGQGFAWLTHLSKTFLINVSFEAFKHVTHWLAERPLMSEAGFISSPVRGLTATANLTCCPRRSRRTPVGLQLRMLRLMERGPTQTKGPPTLPHPLSAGGRTL